MRSHPDRSTPVHRHPRRVVKGTWCRPSRYRGWVHQVGMCLFLLDFGIVDHRASLQWRWRIIGHDHGGADAEQGDEVRARPTSGRPPHPLAGRRRS